MGATHKIEIIVHVDDALNEDQRASLILGLNGHEGVEHAHFTPGLDHLLVVDYDRDLLKAQDVLGYVKKNHIGAELIGGI